MTTAHVPYPLLKRTGYLVCVLGVGSLVACSSSTASTSAVAPAGSSSSSSTSSSSTSSDQTSSQVGGGYQLDPAVTALRFDAEAASVHVTAQDGASAISVAERAQGATTSKQVTGTNAVLTSRCPSGITFGDQCRVDYQVTVPSRTAVDVEGAAGDITLTGPLTNVIVNTSAARITGTGLGAGTVQASTKAGEVDLTFAAAPTSAQVKSDAGNVTVTLPGADKYNVTVNTTVGTADVSVDKDPSSPHRVDVTTTVGAVTVKKG